MTTKPVDYLIPDLRLRLGDTNPDSYRYLNQWLLKALILSVKNLGRFWRDKYLINDKGVVSRNEYALSFTFDESYGVIEKKDEYIITLMATIIILEGSLENSSWDAVSWRDNEISFSNLEKFRSKSDNIKRLIDELNSLILPPTRRLAGTQKQSLPGYLNNPFENTDKIN